MTLILWKAPLVEDADQAKALIADWSESEDDSAFEPSDDIARVADELRRRWPYRLLNNEETVARMSEEERRQYSPEDLKQLRGFDEPEGSPWADLPFWQSDRLLALDIRWGADDEVAAVITALARKCELVLYDPQGPDVFLHTDPLPSDEPDPPPTLADHLKILAMAAFLGALTYGAWLIPIGWLRWPAVIVAGFLFISSLIVVYGVIAAALGWLDVEEGRRATCAPDDPPL